MRNYISVSCSLEEGRSWGEPRGVAITGTIQIGIVLLCGLCNKKFTSIYWGRCVCLNWGRKSCLCSLHAVSSASFMIVLAGWMGQKFACKAGVEERSEDTTLWRPVYSGSRFSICSVQSRRCALCYSKCPWFMNKWMAGCNKDILCCTEG